MVELFSNLELRVSKSPVLTSKSNSWIVESSVIGRDSKVTWLSVIINFMGWLLSWVFKAYISLLKNTSLL